MDVGHLWSSHIHETVKATTNLLIYPKREFNTKKLNINFKLNKVINLGVAVLVSFVAPLTPFISETGRARTNLLEQCGKGFS